MRCSQVADPAEQLSELEKFEDHQQAKEAELDGVLYGMIQRGVLSYIVIYLPLPHTKMSTFNRYFSFPEDEP